MGRYKPNTFDNALIEFDAVAAGLTGGLITGAWLAWIGGPFGPQTQVWDQNEYNKRKQWHKDRIAWLEKSVIGSVPTKYGSAVQKTRMRPNPYAGKIGSRPTDRWPGDGKTGSAPEGPLPQQPSKGQMMEWAMQTNNLPYIIKFEPFAASARG